MANLYLIDKPFADTAVGLAQEDPDAQVVLVQDGVYLGAQPLLAAGKKVYAIGRDVERRGLSGQIDKGVGLIDYQQLVDLLLANKVLNFA
jgi:tRNA 2-thiouridine synthesizing protein B